MALFLGILMLFIGLFIGIPVAFMFLTVTIYYIFIFGYQPSFLIPYGYSQINDTILLAIPLFIIAGRLMQTGGIAEKLVDFVEVMVGRVKGGLGVVTVIACAVFGAISGSAAAALSSIGPVILPRLEKKGYSRGFATALVSNASVLGLLIPPSIVMILYAWIGNQSVLKSFLATIGPGLILALLLSIINLFYMKNKNITDDLTDEISAQEYGKAFGKSFAKKGLVAIPGLLMPIIVLGGIYGGYMTPTEAAGISALYAIPVGFWIYKELNFKKFFNGVVEAAVTTGVIMIMLYGIMILSRILITEDLPGILTNTLLSITENKFILLLLVNLFLIIIGMLMDDVSGVLLATPILLPLMIEIGVDPIHFAAIIGVNLGMGLLTPPTAPILYLGSRVGKTPVLAMFKPTFIMIAFAWLPTLLVTTFFPEIALFLPNLLLGK